MKSKTTLYYDDGYNCYILKKVVVDEVGLVFGKQEMTFTKDEIEVLLKTFKQLRLYDSCPCHFDNFDDFVEVLHEIVIEYPNATKLELAEILDVAPLWIHRAMKKL